LNIASLLFSPIGLVVAGVTGLAVAFGLAMAKSEEFRNRVFGVFQNLAGFISTVIATVSPILQTMWDGAREGLASFAETAGGRLINGLELIVSVLTTVIGAVTEFVSSFMEGFQNAGGEVTSLSTLFLA